MRLIPSVNATKKNGKDIVLAFELSMQGNIGRPLVPATRKQMWSQLHNSNVTLYSNSIAMMRFHTEMVPRASILSTSYLQHINAAVDIKYSEH